MQKLLTELCFIFINRGNVFRRIKIPTLFLGRIPCGTFIPSMIIFGPVVSEKSLKFKKVDKDKDDDGRQMMTISRMAFNCVKV